MKRMLPLAALLILIGGCGDSESSRVVLADYDFARTKSERLAADVYGRDSGTHLFGDSWLKDASPGLWATGDSSLAWFRLDGRDCRISMVCSTHPDLSAAGQAVAIEMNGTVIATAVVDEGWTEQAVEVTVPEGIVRDGLNRFVLRPTLDLGDMGLEPDENGRCRAVFLRRIRISAVLSGEDRDRWNSRQTGSAARPGWEMVEVDGRSRAGQEDTEALPDVFVIVLDAMRFDRATFNGYGRATTPHLDQLAGEAVRFTNVFSNASYTRCAVPSILTGLPWHEHNVVRGVWEEGDALADSAVTLPEVFAAAGYHTIGLSQNPNFSVATRTDQGFSEFYEMWKRDGYRQLDLEAPERFLGERLAEGLSADPVFTYLHLLPPHLPYAPGEDHDLWRGGNGCGTETVRLTHIRDLEAGGKDLPSCLGERVSSLYDGGLHRIDASVGRILAAWGALDRGRDLIVVVMSDHGEGMGEHGYYDHCTTVYDEMTHVPLFIWPAAAAARWCELQDAFLSVEDVMPMLMNIVGLDLPEDGRWPRRFLRLLDGRREGREHILVRTIDSHHTFGIRTLDHLAIWDGFRKQELYDVTQPGGGSDLRLAESDLYTELMGVLSTAIAGGSWTEGEAPTSTLAPEDAEVLRSLGYL